MADTAPGLIALYQQVHLSNTVYVAAMVLFCYDYCLTLEREVRLVWRRRFSASSILYFALRYSAVFNTVLFVIDLAPWKSISDWSCGVVVHVDMFLDIVVLIGAAVFSALRVFALWDRNPWIFIGVLFLGITNPAISLYTFTQMQIGASPLPAPFCGFDPAITASVYENWMVGARLSSVLADVLVLIVTWTRTWPVRVEAARFNITAHITAIFMRDGALYFFVLLIVNVIGLGLARRLELIEPVSTWIALVTTIFTTRFILDLHEVADTLAREDLTQASDSEPGSLLSMAFRTHPNGLPCDLSRTRGPLRSVYGVLTHVATVDDWDESQYGIEDHSVAAAAEHPQPNQLSP